MTAYLPIERQKAGGGFRYVEAGNQLTDPKLLDFISKMAIPPAWRDVHIARSERSKILARGIDSAGRVQAIYSPRFRARQEQLKFDRILRFAEALPDLRRQVEKDLARKRLSKEKVLACIVKLMDQEYFRVGNEQYAKEHQTYGITTIRSKHVDVRGDTVTFDFVGKSHQKHVKQINDRQIARIVKQLDELPGYEIFRYQDSDGSMHDIHTNDVNAYIKQYAGEEFSAKDFRTWGGTLLATTELIAAEKLATKTQRTKFVTETVKNVAKKLGNTPSVARSSYIDPRVIAAYIDSEDMQTLKQAMQSMRPKKYLSRDEQCVLRLLNKTV
ncbi:MAG: topoisomerase [Candidatus Saccharibacteria bacterium]|nr:topoisomerase [Candidatus Saccharibacteria bacterium]